MNHNQVTALLHQLSMTVNSANTWDDNTQIRDVMLVSPDCKFAWLFRIDRNEQGFPSNLVHADYYNCHLYIHEVSECHTVSECLQGFYVQLDNYSDFQVLNIIGEVIDPTQVPVQTVCLKSKS